MSNIITGLELVLNLLIFINIFIILISASVKEYSIEWLEDKWLIIGRSKWIYLTELYIDKFIELLGKNLNFTRKYSNSWKSFIATLVGLICMDIYFTLTVRGIDNISKPSLILLISYKLIAITLVYYHHKIKNKPFPKEISSFVIVLTIFSFINFPTKYIWILTDPSTSPGYHLPFLFLFIPFFYSIIIHFYVVSYEGLKMIKLRSFEQPINFLNTFSLVISSSVFLTVTALIIGKFVEPHTEVPRALQLFISNFIFDFLSLITTLIILSKVDFYKISISLPLRIGGIIVLCWFYAILSLFFGLIFTPDQISLFDSIQYSFGISPLGESELGPYFWSMYTVFFPLIIFLFFLLATWFAKLLTTIIHRITGKFMEGEYSIIMTAAYNASFIGIIKVLIYLFKIF